MRKNLNNSIFLLVTGMILSLGCNFFGASKTEEVKSGRLKYVEKLKYGSVGVSGNQGWYVVDRKFYVDGKKWSPAGLNVTEALGGCEPSPNDEVEALKCDSFENGNEISYVLRIKNDQPDWVLLLTTTYADSRGNNFGEWADDGKVIVFKDFFYRIATGEKQEIAGAPDYPRNSFRGVSPDLETIVYQGICFSGYFDAPAVIELKRRKICADQERLYKNKLEVLWLIDTKTGATKFVELSRDKYDWLVWDETKIKKRAGWTAFFQKKLVWEKDQNGKFQLVFPK